jgi:hypothetical protein
LLELESLVDNTLNLDLSGIQIVNSGGWDMSIKPRLAENVENDLRNI